MLKLESNSMMLKKSSGCNSSRASRSACRAWMMDVPPIEPDVSMTKTVSRGMRTASMNASSGGITIAST